MKHFLICEKCNKPMQLCYAEQGHSLLVHRFSTEVSKEGIKLVPYDFEDSSDAEDGIVMETTCTNTDCPRYYYAQMLTDGQMRSMQDLVDLAVYKGFSYTPKERIIGRLFIRRRGNRKAEMIELEVNDGQK